MKFHKHLINTIITSLQEIFFNHLQADKVVERTLKTQKKWGSKDRHFYAESVYEIVRWWRLLWFYLQKDISNSPHEILKVWAIWYYWKYQELPDWEELKFIPQTINFNSQPTEKAILHSLPDELYQLGLKQLDSKWDKILAASNSGARVFLRINSFRTNINNVIEDLSKNQIEVKIIEDLPHCLELIKRKNIFITSCFKKGFIEVQDHSSQKVAPFLQISNKMRVIDACCGVGGKTLHLATLMNNQGQIIALDVSEKKLHQLKLRARRAGFSNIETRWINSRKVIKRLENQSDRLLLDVPCSGLGVLKRKPGSKWRITEDFIQKLQELQRDILLNYSSLLKSGGKLVYSTCSVLPSENEEQIQWFLNNCNNQFELEEETFIGPHDSIGDGFYMARLIKKKRFV